MEYLLPVHLPLVAEISGYVGDEQHSLIKKKKIKKNTMVTVLQLMVNIESLTSTVKLLIIDFKLIPWRSTCRPP